MYFNRKFQIRICKFWISEFGIQTWGMSIYNPKNHGHYQILREMLIEAREKKLWFQKDLAEKIGKNQAFISKFEAGERRLDLVEVLNLVEILEIDETYFLADFRARVMAFNELTQTALLQQVAAREVLQAKAQQEIERIMRENNLTYADLQKPASKPRKSKSAK